MPSSTGGEPHARVERTFPSMSTAAARRYAAYHIPVRVRPNPRAGGDARPTRWSVEVRLQPVPSADHRCPHAKRTDPHVRVPWSGFDLINAYNAWKGSEAAGRVFSVARDGATTKKVTGLASLAASRIGASI